MPVNWNAYTNTAYLYALAEGVEMRTAFEIDVVRTPIASMNINNMLRYNNGGSVKLSHASTIYGDTYTWLSEVDSTMVAIRFLAYSLNFDVLWDAGERTATIDPSGRNIEFTIGSSFVSIDGNIKQMLNGRGEPVRATIVDDRIFVPLRALGDILNMPVAWNEHTRNAYLYVVN